MWGRSSGSPRFIHHSLDDSVESGYTSGISLVAGGGAGVKGAWTEIIASTPFDSTFLHLETTITNFWGYLDIGIGSSGNEAIIIPDLGYGWSSYARRLSYYNLPLQIPAGSRLCARISNSTASASINSHWFLGEGGVESSLWSIGRVEYIGSVTASDPVTTAGDTKSVWYQLIASTPRDYHGLLLECMPWSGSSVIMDIGLGASSSEIPILSDWYLGLSGMSSMKGPQILPLQIPAGSRVSFRVQTSIATSNVARIYISGILCS